MHLAYTGPVVVAPAMNSNMWTHPATQANLAVLRLRGVRIVDPDEGDLACGMVGPGRLAVLDRIVVAAEESLFLRSDLAGETILITAGPTQEPLDPVRFLSNRSSGRMGFALAEEARARGARVILVHGPVHIPIPAGCEPISIQTAEEMRHAVLARLAESSIVVMAAAVADFRASQVSPAKIKKRFGSRTLDLEPTADILAEVGARKGDRLLVGFAAETEHASENAKQKLHAKNCDMVVANLVGSAAQGTGFDSEHNQGWLLTASGDEIELPRSSKREMAERIFDQVLQFRAELARTRR
jgi:phosphopantothenoylcysteine decarboxylase/phosphopantothenate--cysteine ligase